MADGVRVERDTARRMGRATLRIEALAPGITHGPRNPRHIRGTGSGAAHLVVPATAITAARRVFTMAGGSPQWQLKLGTGLVYIYERVAGGSVAVPALDSGGNPITLTVWNFCRDAYQPADVTAGSGSGAPDAVQLDDSADVLFAVKDHKGDYYITRDCQAVGSMSSSSGSGSGSASGSGSDSGGSDSGGSDSGGGGSDSGGGSGGGSGSGCADPFTGSFEVVTDVTFDPDTCLYTVTKRTLTFANGELCDPGSESTS